MTITKRLYTEKEAAQYLGRTVWSMRELRYSGKIPFVRLSRRIHYDIQDLESFVDKNKVFELF